MNIINYIKKFIKKSFKQKAKWSKYNSESPNSKVIKADPELPDTKWSRYNATDSEIIIKAERDEHPHCEDHHPNLHENEINKLSQIQKNKTIKCSSNKNLM